jgi:hypothetical protein
MRRYASVLSPAGRAVTPSRQLFPLLVDEVRMARILISYRREDSSAYAGRLFDRLSDYFDRENAFIDIDTN